MLCNKTHCLQVEHLVRLETRGCPEDRKRSLLKAVPSFQRMSLKVSTCMCLEITHYLVCSRNMCRAVTDLDHI